jgi:allantoinase
LYFNSEDIADDDTRLKCAPPVRSSSNRHALWEALDEGVIDVIASDHSPCPPRMKYLDEGDFARAWGGISSLGLGLSIIWTCGRARGFGLDDLVRWMAQGPADLLGMRRKGRIEAGADADILVMDPDARWQVTSPGLHNRHKLTPYEGRELQGRVRRTYLRGRLVYEDGRWSGSPCGVVMRRGW